MTDTPRTYTDADIERARMADELKLQRHELFQSRQQCDFLKNTLNSVIEHAVAFWHYPEATENERAHYAGLIYTAYLGLTNSVDKARALTNARLAPQEPRS